MQIDYSVFVRDKLLGRHKGNPSFQFVYPFLKGMTVLDLGCADGLYLKYFNSHSIGLERQDKLAYECQKKGLTVVIGNLDGCLPFKEETFDGVFFSHVLEHLDHPANALREIHRITKCSGTLVLGLPTEKNLFRFVLRRNYFKGTHLYSFSVDGAIKLLKYCGFRVKRIFYCLPRRLSKPYQILNFLQRIPLREQIAMAYWIVSEKKL